MVALRIIAGAGGGGMTPEVLSSPDLSTDRHSVKQKRKARMGFNPKTQQKIKIPAKTGRQISCCQGRKGRVLGVKK
jgi:hypothetical protein